MTTTEQASPRGWRTLRRIGCVGLLLVAAINPVVLDTIQSAGLPGSESRDTADLDATTQRRVEAMLRELRGRGWPAWVRATRRDRERQAFYKQMGFSKTMNSLHRTGKAADINLALPWALLPLHIVFYYDLRRTAEKHNLCSGGRWVDAKKGRLWRLVGLGWDPAHVQRGGC